MEVSATAEVNKNGRFTHLYVFVTYCFAQGYLEQLGGEGDGAGEWCNRDVRISRGCWCPFWSCRWLGQEPLHSGEVEPLRVRMVAGLGTPATT